MAYDETQLAHYNKKADLIPINPWNKMRKGKERGKTPVHTDWTARDYATGEAIHKDWINQGYNLGYRIHAHEVVVDMDPRNYGGIDVETLIADEFGYFDFDELCLHLPVVKTGGGGYHIYCDLPSDVDCQLLRETIEEFPGVEFKKKGRQVLCAGSKHPSGNFYTWENVCDRQFLPESILKKIKRKRKTTTEYSSGQGALNGDQLRDMVLDKLDPTDYSSNDKWFPLLCAAHHATNGEGIEEFVAWSLQDEQYVGSENDIRARWESLWDKENSITAGTLVHELKEHGADQNDIKAALTFADMPKLEIGEEDNIESDMIKDLKHAASEIDIDEIYRTPPGEAGVEGAAVRAANNLHISSSDEEIMQCLRLIKAADSMEALKAQGILVDKKILKQSMINRLLKELEATISDDFGLLLSQKSLEKTFNNGRHLISSPSGNLWAFYKTHWIEINDEFLGKLIQQILHSLKEKMEIKVNELSIIQQAVKLTRIQVSTMTDRLHNMELPPSVINCQNGELWIGKDGSHILKPHNYRSYLLNCLNVDYDPSSSCPLFMETINSIFEDYLDTDDMVRHVGEVMGYMLQPYKNIASWWLFRGPGGDGKSTLLKILGGILKKALYPGSSKTLAIGTSEGNDHVAHSLVGKLCITVEELPANYLLKDAGMKMLSENTEMTANPKHSKEYEFMYCGNVIMCSNGFPGTRDLSHGMFRRAHIIPFNRQFTLGGKEDLDRASRIINDKAEMSGVLNFMLEGLKRLRDRGNFLEPDSCKDAKEEWMGVSNNVLRFVRETIVQTGKSSDSLGEMSVLYGNVYNTWCEDNGIDLKSRHKKMTFRRALEDLGFAFKIGGGNRVKVYGGLLREDLEIDNFL